MTDGLDIIDGHVHSYSCAQHQSLVDDIRNTGAQQFCVLVTQRDDNTGQWDNALSLKHRFPREAFLFGGLDLTTNVPFADQLQHLIDIGCDGLKLLIGKPDRRKALGFPLDSPTLTPMLELAERTQFPILWHVGDPPEFWSEHTVPQWARTRGWWYDVTHPTKQQIDAEINGVFKRHPRLNLILPHFFFLADRLNDAATLLDAHPTFSFDLAPGVEMYHNFTANRDAAREFSIRYADRIIFGSDFGLPCGWHRDRGMMIRRFLETDDSFAVPDDPAMSPDDRPPLRGLALPRGVLQKIYADNFRRHVSAEPKQLRTHEHPVAIGR